MTTAGPKEKGATSKTKEETKNSESFEKRLKAKCKNCTAASIKVYLAAIRRLHKLTGDGNIPSTGGWLNKPELMKKYDALPLRLAEARPDLAIVRLRSPREVRAWVAGPLAQA